MDCFKHNFNNLFFLGFFVWQSLLSDRDKLCQLLETHPKLMQMLQVSFENLIKYIIFVYCLLC